MTKSGDGSLNVKTDQNGTIEKVNSILWAIGRTSNTADLGLESAGLGKSKIDHLKNK